MPHVLHDRRAPVCVGKFIYFVFFRVSRTGDQIRGILRAQTLGQSIGHERDFAWFPFVDLALGEPDQFGLRSPGYLTVASLSVRTMPVTTRPSTSSPTNIDLSRAVATWHGYCTAGTAAGEGGSQIRVGHLRQGSQGWAYRAYRDCETDRAPQRTIGGPGLGMSGARSAGLSGYWIGVTVSGVSGDLIILHGHTFPWRAARPDLDQDKTPK